MINFKIEWGNYEIFYNLIDKFKIIDQQKIKY